MVSVTVAPLSAEELGRYWLLPLTDLTMLLTITLMTLIVSVELESPAEASLVWAPSMIFGITWIKSSELPIPASLTAVVAASVTRAICELERELVRVLLVDLDPGRIVDLGARSIMMVIYLLPVYCPLVQQVEK